MPLPKAPPICVPDEVFTTSEVFTEVEEELNVALNQWNKMECIR